jgi:hypothetical protein
MPELQLVPAISDEPETGLSREIVELIARLAARERQIDSEIVAHRRAVQRANRRLN